MKFILGIAFAIAVASAGYNMAAQLIQSGALVSPAASVK